MKRLRKFAAFALAAAVCTGAVAQAPDLSRLDIVTRSVPNGPIASVNGVPISRDEFVDLYEEEVRVLQSAKGALTDADRVGLGVYSLGQVVQREILKQEASKRAIQVPEEEVDALYDKTIEAFKAAGRGQVSTEDQILATAGTTREQARAEIRKSLVIEKMRDELAKEAGIVVSDAELKEAYEENKEVFRRPDSIHIKQIYFNVPKVQGDAVTVERNKAKEKAERVLQLLRQGQTFEALARTESDGLAEVKAAGGDMGPIPVNEMPPSLVEAAQGLKPGEVSGVIESPFGFHIVKLVEITSSVDPTFEDVRVFLRRKLMGERSEKAVRDFVQAKLQSGDYEVADYLDLDRELQRRPDLVEELVGGSGAAGQ